MKITYYQLEKYLTTLAPIYLVSSEELLLKQDAIMLIRKAAKQQGFSERIYLDYDDAFNDSEKLYTLLYSASLFCEKRLIELNFHDHTPHKIIATLLENYAKKPVDQTILIINAGKIDEKMTKSAWYKAIDNIGISLAIWPIPREQLTWWIKQRAKKYNLQFQTDAANLLADYVEGNLIAASQTLEKIYLFKPEKIIDQALIKTIITNESHYTIFDFIDKLIGGESAKALTILETLKTEGIEPTLILWGITRELRLLAEIAQQGEPFALSSARSTHLEEAFKKYRIFSKRQLAMRRFLSKFTLNHCWQYLTYAAKIDTIIKGASSGNVWHELQLFCLRLG